MPTIIALHVALLTATGAMIYRADRIWILWVGLVLIALSPLTSLGTLNQLIAQVGGLAILVSICAVAYRLLDVTEKFDSVGAMLNVALLSAALLIWYPEVFAFAIVGIGALLIIGCVRARRLHIRPLVLSVSAATVAILACGPYMADVARLLMERFSPQGRLDSATIFPQFLMPSGIPALWGLQDLNHPAGDPWISLSILIGGLLLVITLGWAVLAVWRQEIAAVVLVVMLAAVPSLFSRADGFNLFKLAMFAQPFLIATVVSSLRAVPRTPPNGANGDHESPRCRHATDTDWVCERRGGSLKYCRGIARLPHK